MLVASAIDLPEWSAFAHPCAGEADVSISLGEGPLPAYPADCSTFVEGDTVGFCIDGIACWTIAGGRSIVLHPSQAADPRELRLFTLGSAWGLLGYQRGHAMWHGSAVERGGRAVLFCGAAGEGKSTMAAAMIAAGARLVGDDLSRIEPAAAGARIHPSSARIKLWGEALDRFGWRERVIEQDLLREDKFHCAVPAPHADAGPLPLAAVVVLASGRDVALERLGGSEALTAVLEGTVYRGEALDALGMWGAQAALAAQVVAQVPVWRLTRPRDLARIGESIAAAEEILARS